MKPFKIQIHHESLHLGCRPAWSLGMPWWIQTKLPKDLAQLEQCLETDPSSKHLRDTLVFRLSSAVKTHALKHFVDGFKWVLNKPWDHRMRGIHQFTQAYFSIQMLPSGSGQSFLRSLFLLPFFFLSPKVPLVWTCFSNCYNQHKHVWVKRTAVNR